MKSSAQHICFQDIEQLAEQLFDLVVQGVAERLCFFVWFLVRERSTTRIKQSLGEKLLCYGDLTGRVEKRRVEKRRGERAGEEESREEKSREE